MPKVSVVIPVYNAEKYIEDALQSVFSQTYQDFEIIVVNDGSTDQTDTILMSYSSRIRYFKIVNSGPAKARNTGIREACGEYIAFLDADDIWRKDKLECQIKYADKHPEFKLLYCDRQWINAGGEPCDVAFQTTHFPEGMVFEQLFMENFIATPAVLVAKEVFESVGLFSEESKYRVGEDYHMWLRIAEKYQIGCVKDHLFKCRIHDANSTKNQTVRYIGIMSVMEWARKSPYWHNVPRVKKVKLIRARMMQYLASFVYGFIYNDNYCLAKDALVRYILAAYFLCSLKFYVLYVFCCLPPRAIVFLKATNRRMKDVCKSRYFQNK